MKIFIKVASRHYDRLLSRFPPGSRGHEALLKATPIEHTLDGVEFEGYTIPCDPEQARVIRDAARRCCPEILRDIERAIDVAV